MASTGTKTGFFPAGPVGARRAVVHACDPVRLVGSDHHRPATGRGLDRPPLLVYVALMWGISFAVGLRLRLPDEENATVAFTAASNNFELAIAVAIGVFGVTSGEALAGGGRPARRGPRSRRPRLPRPVDAPPVLRSRRVGSDEYLERITMLDELDAQDTTGLAPEEALPIIKDGRDKFVEGIEVAPDEIRADVEIFADGALQITDLLIAAGGDEAAVDPAEIQSLAESVFTPEYDAAAQSVTAWRGTNCS